MYNQIRYILFRHRYETLLGALILLLFDSVFFPDRVFFRDYIWPLNMVLLGIASVSIFSDRHRIVIWTKNFLFVLVVLIPFFWEPITYHRQLLGTSLSIYIFYYILIFAEVLRQILLPGKVTFQIIYAAFGGYLLLAVIGTFLFLLVEFFHPGSFTNQAAIVEDRYNEMIYYSIITLTSIGYGDIVPTNNESRLITAFFGMIGQFYMVVLVGILISKYVSHSEESQS